MKKILTAILTFCFVILIFDFFIFNYAYAQVEPKIQNPVSVNSINEYVSAAVSALLKVLGPVVVLFLVISGVMFATARGNPEKLNEAKRMLLYTSIGAAIVFGAWLLAELVTETVGQVVGS